MSLEFTPHILPLLGAALLAVLLLPTAWKNRRDPIALWFAATLVALFVWSVGYALEIMAVQVLDKIFWLTCSSWVFPPLSSAGGR